MPSAARRASLAVLGTLPLLLCSCSGSSESLEGRWYNRSNSLRFQPGGVVVWYSERGTATGRFYYDSTRRRAAKDEPVHNMTMKLVRSGEPVHGEYELQFLGGERLRITQLNDRRTRTFQVPPVMVLKRADESSEESIPLPAPEENAPEGTPLSRSS